MANASKRYDVFLNHDSSDKAAVELLAHKLRSENVELFLDQWHLIPGEPWQEALEQALDESSTCAVFLGPGGLGPWQHEEMRSALEERVRGPQFRVIPVLLPGASVPEPKALPRFLRRLTWVDFRSGLDSDDALHRLRCGIQGIAPGAAATGFVSMPPAGASESEEPSPPRDSPNRAWWLVGIAVALVVAMIGLLPGLEKKKPEIETLYRVRVTVLDPQQVPVEDATVWSTFGGEPKKVAGGWQFDIPAASVPAAGQLTVLAERKSYFQKGRASAELREDPNVALTVQLSRPSARVRGVVLDPTGAAVADARVSVLGYGDEAVTTTEDGTFILDAHAALREEVRLHVEHPDFRPTDQYHPAGDTPATIQLRKR